MQPLFSQSFQQIQGVIKTDTRHFQLFRRETVADDEGWIGILANHFPGDFQHRQREAGAVFTAATPLIVTLV